MKTYFGQIDIYGIAYGNTTADPNGDPRPFQMSSAIANNPFTPANSSLIAYQIQQTHGAMARTGELYDVSLFSERTFGDRQHQRDCHSPSWRPDIISSCCSPGWTSPTAATCSPRIIRWT